MSFGRKVDNKELLKVLAEEDRKEVVFVTIKQEILELKVGEALAYKSSNVLATHYALKTVTATLKGNFSIFDNDGEIIVYREK